MTDAEAFAARVQGAHLSAPLPLLPRFKAEPPGLCKVIGDSGGDERSAWRVAGTDVPPVPLGDRVGQVAMTHVVSAFGAEHCVRRRVDAGLGQDVAPVAQRVSPGPKPEGRVLGQPTEAPAGTHEGADVIVDGSRVDFGEGGERVVQAGACLARPLGDVLGHVCGNGVITEPTLISAQGPNVDLDTPSHTQLTHGWAVGRADQDPFGRCTHRVND